MVPIHRICWDPVFICWPASEGRSLSWSERTDFSNTDLFKEVWKNASARAIARNLREACRHIDISESSQTIAAILAERIPLAALYVLRLHHEKRSVEAVAVGATSAAELASLPRRLSSYRSGSAWLRGRGWGEVARFHRTATAQHREVNDALFQEILPESLMGRHASRAA